MPTEFEEKVYKLCSKVPKGKVTTYGRIAQVLGSHPRAVGQALKKNPYAPKVPCHRVVGSDGNLTGYQGKSKGTALKKKENMLKEEGVKFNSNKIDPKSIFNFF